VTTSPPQTPATSSERFSASRRRPRDWPHPRSIRYYEDAASCALPDVRGRLPLYDASDLEQLRFIKGLRDDAGLSIADISQVVEDEESRRRTRAALELTDDPAERRRILLERLASLERLHGRLDAKLARLQAMFEDVEARRRRSTTSSRLRPGARRAPWNRGRIVERRRTGATGRRLAGAAPCVTATSGSSGSGKLISLVGPGCNPWPRRGLFCS